MKNKKLMLFSGGICLLLTLFFGCGDRSGEKEYNKAMASLKDGDLSRAQGQMKKAIRKLSDREKKALANNQLGIILWNLGKQDQAAEKFSESCRLTEELTGANLNFGIALFHAGEFEQAEFEFTKILSEQPENHTAHIFIGMTHMKQKDWEGASKVISEGLKNNPADPVGQNALALAELHIGGKSDDAVARLKQTISAYPNYAPATYNLAVIYDLWIGNTDKALDWYNKYLQKAGTNAKYETASNQAISRLGGKIPVFNTAPQKRIYPETAKKYITQGSKLHAAKQYEEAVNKYSKAIQADPSQKTAYYNLGLSYYELQEYRDAENACINALKLDPNFSNARYMLALSYTKQNRWYEAEKEAEALKNSDPTQGKAMLKYISDARK